MLGRLAQALAVDDLDAAIKSFHAEKLRLPGEPVLASSKLAEFWTSFAPHGAAE